MGEETESSLSKRFFEELSPKKQRRFIDNLSSEWSGKLKRVLENPNSLDSIIRPWDSLPPEIRCKIVTYVVHGSLRNAKILEQVCAPLVHCYAEYVKRIFLYILGSQTIL